jgi:predicted 3-demethylubiquinone-9 3-methyltransferase (glyoxalase superfamily)
MPKITTFLAFDDRAEEAAKFYVSIFKNSEIVKTTRYGDAGPGVKGSVMVVVFKLDGQELAAMNGGPHFKLTDGISLSVDCKTQKEVDDYSEKLTSGGGQQGPCGWVTDKFGLSWQINPSILGEMLGDPDPAKARRVMEAMLTMKKIDIEALKKAYAGDR